MDKDIVNRSLGVGSRTSDGGSLEADGTLQVDNTITFKNLVNFNFLACLQVYKGQILLFTRYIFIMNS